MKSSVRFIALAAATGLVAACAETSPKPSISQVLVAPSTATVSVGESVQLTATLSIMPAGTPYSIVWTSSDSAHARVDSTGDVLGVGASPGVSICATAATGNPHTAVVKCATVVIVPALINPGPTSSLDGTWSGPISTAALGNYGTVTFTFAEPSDTLSGTWTISYTGSSSFTNGTLTGTILGPNISLVLTPIGTNPCLMTITASVVTTGVSQVTIDGTYASCPASPNSGTFSITRQ